MFVNGSRLRVVRMGVDTHDEPIVYLDRASDVARAEGFSALSRVEVELAPDRRLIATLNVVEGLSLAFDEVGLSESAWTLLDARPGETARLTHAESVASMGHVRAKLYGRRLARAAFDEVVRDIVARRYSTAQVAALVAGCAGDRLDESESLALTEAMIGAGSRLTWDVPIVADKHSVGGLPGNRTTPIVVAIAASCGLVMPKTSSRAITSPAGTADAVETLTNVALDLEDIRRVVRAEGACLAWGGSATLSPADDLIIRVERALDVDSEGLLVASVLSKKAAAGSTHVVIDMPVGATAKVRDEATAQRIAARLRSVASRVGLTLDVCFTDGSQPVGRGIGPALEARDVLAVLRRDPDAPTDLRDRALLLAARLLELTGAASAGHGAEMAHDAWASGRAWAKFRAICHAQGALREPPVAPLTQVVRAQGSGTVVAVDNRRIARLAKLAGAPGDAAAGVTFHAPIGARLTAGDPLCTVHAETPGELEYAMRYALKEAAGFVRLA